MKKTLFLFIIAIVSLACSTEKEIKPGDIIRLSEPTVTLYEQEVDTQPLQETAISVEVIEGTTLWDIAEYATGSGWNWEVLFHMNNMSPSRLYYRDRGYGREPMVRLSIGEEIFIPSHWKTTLPVSVRPISTFDVVVNYVPTNLNLLVQGNVGKAYVRAPQYDNISDENDVVASVSTKPEPGVTKDVYIEPTQNYPNQESIPSVDKISDDTSFWDILWKILVLLWLGIILYYVSRQYSEFNPEEYDTSDNELLEKAIDTASQKGHGFTFTKDGNGGLTFTTEGNPVVKPEDQQEKK